MTYHVNAIEAQNHGDFLVEQHGTRRRMARAEVRFPKQPCAPFFSDICDRHAASGAGYRAVPKER